MACKELSADVRDLISFDSGDRSSALIARLYQLGWIERVNKQWRVSELGLYWLPVCRQ